MKQLRLYTVHQLTPGMLQNPKDEELLLSLRTKKRKLAKTDWTILEEAGTKLYRGESPGKGVPGKMGVPMQNWIATLITAGTHVAYKGKTKISTAKTTILFDFLDFKVDFVPFNGCDENGNIEWKPFIQGGVMHQGSSETAVCITRPRIPHWSMTVPVIFDCDREIAEKTVDALFDIAGRKVGLCDWRPTKKGRFGRFVIDKIEVLPFEEPKQIIEHVQYTPETAPQAMLELAGLL